MSESSWPDLFGAGRGEVEGGLSSDGRATASEREKQQLAAIHQKGRKGGRSQRIIERMVMAAPSWCKPCLSPFPPRVRLRP